MILRPSLKPPMPSVGYCAYFLTVAAALATSTLAAKGSTGAQSSLPYFGAKAPGEVAELFAPGLVSRPDRFEARIAFSPDLQECYLTETDATFSHPKLLVAHRNAGAWTEFVDVPFASEFKVCHEPFLSSDNRKLYFTADGDDAVPTNRRDLWVVERTGSGWGKPSRLPAPINSDAGEFFFNQTADGTIVFASNRPGGKGDFDLYYMEKSSEGMERAVNFGTVLNTPGPEYDPCISQDGRFIVFASARHGGPHLDLYVSFRDDQKTWSTPVPLNGNVNTPANEYGPSLSPDGRYLFFVRHDGKQSDIYWMATAGITRTNYPPTDE